MLWKKEAGNIYVDLLKNVKFVPQNLRLNRAKNNSLALKTRMKGNAKFHQNDFEGAMALYNESICLSESNSANISFGYANRSNCFLKLQIYERCLVDIQLAKDAGYPQCLMVKLDTRKRECEKSLKSVVPSVPTLNVQEIHNPPWMSNLLQIQQKFTNAKGATAKEDIKVNETLLMEESYVHMMHTDETNYCSCCWKEQMNFIPCGNCADTMYCSQKCVNNNFHEIECDMAVHFEDNIDGESSIFIIRSVIIAINTFADIKEMMDFVEKCISSYQFEIDEKAESPKMKYRTFLKLSSYASNGRILDLRRKSLIIFNAIMDSKLAIKFQTTESQRFLVHVIVHHILILRSNSFMGPMPQDQDGTRFVQKLDLLTSYFEHSCLPNIIHLDKERVTVIKTILPIKQGDELVIAYINCDDYETKKERNDYLEEVYGFRCKCRRCTVDISNCLEQENDLYFNFVAKNVLKLNENSEIELARDIKNSCIKFLIKYQSMITTKESVFISNTLGDVLRLELSSVK